MKETRKKKLTWAIFCIFVICRGLLSMVGVGAGGGGGAAVHRPVVVVPFSSSEGFQ
jgi:hypothetical protein